MPTSKPTPASSKSKSGSKKAAPRRARNPRLKRILWVLLAAAGLGVLFTASGFAYAASRETHDNFCASCHTQPESTFYERSVAGQPVDLASAHTAKETRCIDCHSGVGVSGRVQAELLGAHNALLFYTGRAVQPAPLTHPVTEESCLKCHQKVLTGQAEMNTHFHVFLPRWQAADPKAATCVSCHSGHANNGEAQLAYLNREQTSQVCQACHQVLRGNDD